MQEVIVEQILCRTGDCIASLRRAGAAQCDDSGRLPHRALLPLELRGLSLPDAASAVEDLQDVFFQLRQRQSFRYFAFGLILHQEFLQNGILRVEYTLLFQ